MSEAKNFLKLNEFMENKVFKKMEVVGVNKDAAMENAPFKLRVNATTAFEKWRETAKDVSDAAINEWMKEYLKTKKFNTAGDGAYIVIQSAVADSRKRPYQVEKIKHDSKTHTPQLMYVGRTASGEVVFTEKKSADALNAAKDCVADLHENIFIRREGVIKEGNADYAVVKYTPSKGTKNCILLAFGYISLD